MLIKNLLIFNRARFFSVRRALKRLNKCFFTVVLTRCLGLLEPIPAALQCAKKKLFLTLGPGKCVYAPYHPLEGRRAPKSHLQGRDLAPFCEITRLLCGQPNICWSCWLIFLVVLAVIYPWKQRWYARGNDMCERRWKSGRYTHFLRYHFQPFGLNLVLPSVVNPSGAIAKRGTRHLT